MKASLLDIKKVSKFGKAGAALWLPTATEEELLQLASGLSALSIMSPLSKKTLSLVNGGSNQV